VFDVYRVCCFIFMIVAALAFVGFLMATNDSPVIGVLGMGFSAVVFMLGILGLILMELGEDLRLLTGRRRKRLQAGKQTRHQAWLAEIEKQRRAVEAHRADRQRERVDPQSMQITPRDVVAQSKTEWRHRREIWRGWWTRFWNGVRRRIARVLGEENTILIGIVFWGVRIVICISLFAPIAAAIIAWSLW